MGYQVLPFKANSFGTLIDVNGQLQWINQLASPVPLPVVAKKALFSTPSNELPDNFEPGCVWKQHLGQVTYFTPGADILPAWVTTYIKFYDNFIGQKVKVVLCDSNGGQNVMHDWETISYINGSFQPVLQDSRLINLKANVNYWVEVHFEKTVNKAPGFYGNDGIEGFLAKYWWSISQAPISDIYKSASPTDLATHPAF